MSYQMKMTDIVMNHRISGSETISINPEPARFRSRSEARRHLSKVDLAVSCTVDASASVQLQKKLHIFHLFKLYLCDTDCDVASGEFKIAAFCKRSLQKEQAVSLCTRITS